MGSGSLISVRSLRPFTALSAPTGSAFGNFAALSTRRFAVRRHASFGPPTSSRRLLAFVMLPARIDSRLHAKSSATPPSQTSSAALWTAFLLIEGGYLSMAPLTPLEAALKV
jgi:hypothetical protein